MLSTDAERTCQLVASRHVEDSQIGKLAKLLGKAAYRKKCDYQHKITHADRMLSSPRRLWPLRSIFVTKSTSSPMLDGSANQGAM